MADFIGRTAELSLLAKAFESPRSELIPIYGRRRVGKSELILRFMADRPGVYYLGQQSAAALQVREFLAEAARGLGLPLLAELRAADWRQVLLTVVGQWDASHPGSKLVLALDEFQWIAAASPGLMSALQHCWDREWKRAGNVVLLLCGSYLGFMEREVLGRASPLFGRRTAQIHLQPFRLPGRGPVPFALVSGRIGREHTSSSAVSRSTCSVSMMASPSTATFDSPSSTSSRRCSTSPPSCSARSCVKWRRTTPCCSPSASGHGSPRAIAAATELPERNLHYYLQQLVSLGYLQRRYPLDCRRPNPRHVRFGIDDPLLRFWFRFIFPNMSAIRGSGAARVLGDRIAPTLDAWFGAGFERLCREALPLVYAAEGVGAGFEVGGVLEPSAREREEAALAGRASRRADRRRRAARRQLDGPRRVQVGSGAVAQGPGSGAGPQGARVSQPPGRDAGPPLLRAPQAGRESGVARLVLARGSVRADRVAMPRQGRPGVPSLHPDRRGRQRTGRRPRVARRDEGAYWAYATEEQCGHSGCIAGRMQRGLSHGLPGAAAGR